MDALIATGLWKSIHPLLKVIEVDWDFKIHYGILYSTEPSDMIKNLIDTLKTINPEAKNY